MSGTWVLHFSWGCSSTYAQSPITFNPDGTFTGLAKGKWLLRDGTLMLSFDSGPAKYGGAVAGSVACGEMSTFTGLSGCWYLVKQGTVGISLEEADPEHDAAGNVRKVVAHAGADGPAD